MSHYGYEHRRSGNATIWQELPSLGESSSMLWLLAPLKFLSPHCSSPHHLHSSCVPPPPPPWPPLTVLVGPQGRMARWAPSPDTRVRAPRVAKSARPTRWVTWVVVVRRARAHGDVALWAKSTRTETARDADTVGPAPAGPRGRPTGPTTTCLDG